MLCFFFHEQAVILQHMLNLLMFGDEIISRKQVSHLVSVSTHKVQKMVEEFVAEGLY